MGKKTRAMLIIVPIILFALLAVLVGTGLMTNFENWVYLESIEEMSPIKTTIIVMITHLGGPIIVPLICLGLFAFKQTRHTYAIPASMSVLLATFANILLKNLFVRDRPDFLQIVTETDYSFPSGHAMINMALYATLFLLISSHIKNKRTRLLLSAVFLILPLLIGYSRIYLGVHYVTDVIGGWLLGIAIAAFVYISWINRYKKSPRKK